ncbi:glycosyltransferase family 4 protein [Flavobacteriaceae bacterium]|nr:glycosyltransferase family 4 protein [Flavobacteriaceae bacterium]MDB9993752.1 glycosyltransferase family 4 protein [Flavobacteriaceae bacterium]
MDIIKKKKVVIIGKLPPPYMGPAIATQIILNSELKDEFDLIHFNVTLNKTIETQGKKSFNKVFTSIKLYLKYNKCLNIHKPDMVLVPFAQETIGFYKDIPYLLLPRLKRIKVIGQLRGSNFKTWLQNSSYLTNKVVHFTLKKTNGIIVLGNNLRYLFTDIFKAEKIFVVPNGADFSFPSIKQVESCINILYFANMYESKGVEKVVDAAIKLDNPKCIFTFAGGWRKDGKFKNNLLQKVKNSTSMINVIPPVSGNKKFSLFAKADIFVFPPIAPEGHPWVLVEAMAAGLPIISTDQGAIVESVIDGENGFIVDAGSSDQIVKKLQLLIDNEKLRLKMATRSKQLYTDKFTEKCMVENLSHVFNEILK